ncbi:MAG: Hsp33 family molecular chaperone HslO [Acutalibacteraceae bacterium]|nr:Hsp33 family molecular chaperone HslO [Acutalibacteraceae bacterium]
MGKLIRAITSDGAVMASALDSTDIVAKAEKFHRTSAVMTAALGRLLTATSIMGNMMKGEKDTITVRIKADGPAGAVVAVADSKGDVRGYVGDANVEIPLKENGKLDVSGAVGTDGLIYVIKDIGLKEPYSGSVPLVSGEIAEDITAYYAISEQIPTVCALGVLVNPDLSVRKAGGIIIQLLPGADNSTIDKLEENLKHIRPITTMMDEGMDIKDILFEMLSGFETEILYEQEAKYYCPCSRERTKKMLSSMSKDELDSMAEEMEEIKVECHFCDKKYTFTPEQIREISSMKKA